MKFYIYPDMSLGEGVHFLKTRHPGGNRQILFWCVLTGRMISYCPFFRSFISSIFGQ